MHFLSFSHLKVQSLWQGLGMTSPRPRGGRRTYWKWSCPTGCHPVGLERWKLCVPVILKSKGSVAKPCFWYLFFIFYTWHYLFSVHGFLPEKCLRRDVSNWNVTHTNAWRDHLPCMRFVEGTVLQVTVLRFGAILLVAELVPKKAWALRMSQLSIAIYFSPSLKALVFLKWREQFSTYCCRIEIDEKLAHVFKGLWEHLEKVKNRRASKTKVPPSPAF